MVTKRDGGDTMVTTIVAAVRTFHSKISQESAALAVVSARACHTDHKHGCKALVARLEPR